MYKLAIRGIEVYHGSKVVDNSYYIEHFKARGKDVEHFLCDVVGRDQRYLIDSDEENSMTMALEAIKKVLKTSNLTGKDLDMIIFSSQLAEYAAPPTSIKIHNAIEGRDNCICYDMNSNCTGMTIALEHASKYMSVSQNINRVLIVGSDYINMTVDPEVEYCYGHYGDAACAMILEKTDEDCGVIDAIYQINSAEHNNIVFPSCGFSKLFTVQDRNELKLRWKPFDCPQVPLYVDNMKKLLTRNSLTVDDVKMFCFSQYIIKNVEEFRSLLGIDESKSIFIGKEYGYTGTSSPFIALYESMRRGMVKKGDYILFWTVSAGAQNISLLLKL